MNFSGFLNRILIPASVTVIFQRNIAVVNNFSVEQIAVRIKKKE